MPNVHCMVILPFRTNLPKDVSVNTFTFGAGAGTASALASTAVSRLSTFYNTTPSGASNPVKYWLGGQVDRPKAWIKVYDLADPKPRAPIYDDTFDLGVNIDTHDLPSEVAMCASFGGAPSSGTPQARRRGRIYLGPLRYAAKNSTDNVAARPVQGIIDSLVGACIALSSANDGSGNWVVWSRAGSSFTEVTQGWVDNEFDTQRRRQPTVTDRQTWTGL